MDLRWIGGLAIATVLAAQPAMAQQSAQPSNDAATAEPTVDASRLGLDLGRIQRQIQRAQVREERDGLNLRYFLDVYGQAPPLVTFTREDNLLYGPAPYGAPTHQDMLNIMTPQEFRSPAMDLGALMQWLAKRTPKGDKK
jgi:hypothetical protein